jgi:hypothetical protein
MKIIVRSCGERTTQKCIELAQKQGDVKVITARPFGESIRQTFTEALTYADKWVCVIDADVLLYDGVLQQAIDDLEIQKNKNIFCLDGITLDKIFIKTRRAGIHIYQTKMLEIALKYIQNDKIKPESHVRKTMAAIHNFKTYAKCPIVFGQHDYEQYYSDLWRKAICQSQKLPRKSAKMKPKWANLKKSDADYLVVYQAHKWASENNPKIIIDADRDYNANENIARLGLQEKKPLL